LDQYINAVETIKIVNSPIVQEEIGDESIEELETIDLAIAKPAASGIISTENRCENWP
jgi:hypothetical protein